MKITSRKMLKFSYIRVFFSIIVWSHTTATNIEEISHDENKNEGLHFTRELPRGVYDKIKMAAFNYPELYSPSAIACPAESEDEKIFNRESSFGNNSLFVQSTYEETNTAKDVDYDVCSVPYKTTVLYNTESMDFQFGFEIYYDKSKFKDYDFEDSDRKDYFSIKSPSSHDNSEIWLVPKLPDLDSNNETKMGFIWISAFQTKYNHKLKRLAHTAYNLSQTPRNIDTNCDDYDLANGYFTNIAIDKLYEAENQKRMLENIKVPTKDLDDEFKEAACESENQCFSKWLSVPTQQFHPLATKPTSCSNLLTVPIWKSTIESVLNKLDNFLFALSQVIGYPIGKIVVISGIHDVLRLPTNDHHNPTNKPITLAENDMHVPSIIYKLVHYGSKICKNHKNEQGELVSMTCDEISTAIIIVIHNNPYFNPATDKICEDVSIDWGWEEILNIKNTKQDRVKSSYIYCCPATDASVQKKLGLDKTHEEESTKIKTIEMKLTSIPFYDPTTGKFNYYNVREFAVGMYREIFEGEVVLQPKQIDEIKQLMVKYGKNDKRFREEDVQATESGKIENEPNQSETQVDAGSEMENISESEKRKTEDIREEILRHL